MRLAAFVISVVVARHLGADTLGEFTFFLTLFVLTAESLYAFDVAFLREAGASPNLDHQRQFLRWAVAGKVILTCAAALLTWALTPHVSSFFGKSNAGDVVRWAITAGALNAVFMSMTARFQQQRRFGRVSLLQPLPNVLVMLIVVALIALHQIEGITDITKIYFLVGAVVALIGGTYVLILERNPACQDRLPSGSARIYFLTIATFLLAKSISLVSIRLDVFFIGKLLSYEELGLYGVAIRLSVLLSLFTAVTATLMLPRASEAMASRERFRRFVGLALLYAGIQSMVAIALLILARPLITLIFGHQYEGATTVTIVLLLQGLVTAYGSPLQALIQCGMSPSISVAIACLRMLVSVPLLWWLVPRFGAEGAAVSVAVAAIAVLAVQIHLVLRKRPRVATQGNSEASPGSLKT